MHMSASLQPIAPNLWSEEPEPQLLGGRDSNGKIFFPIPEDESAKDVEVVKLILRNISSIVEPQVTLSDGREVDGSVLGSDATTIFRKTVGKSFWPHQL